MRCVPPRHAIHHQLGSYCSLMLAMSECLAPSCLQLVPRFMLGRQCVLQCQPCTVQLLLHRRQQLQRSHRKLTLSPTPTRMPRHRAYRAIARQNAMRQLASSSCRTASRATLELLDVAWDVHAPYVQHRHVAACFSGPYVDQQTCVTGHAGCNAPLHHTRQDVSWILPGP